MGCEESGRTALFSSSCGTMAWVADNSSCSPVTYTGQACREALLEWKSCIVGQNSSNTIFISAVESQVEVEQQAKETLQIISQSNKYTSEVVNNILECLNPYNIIFSFNLKN